MNPFAENSPAGKFFTELREYDEVAWYKLFHQIFRVGALSAPLPLKGVEPSEILADLYYLFDADLDVQEAYQRAILSFYDHMVARRSFEQDRNYFVELHWYFGAVKPAGAFKLLFRVLNSGLFEKYGPPGDRLQLNLLTMLKDLSASEDKRELMREYLQNKTIKAQSPVIYQIAFSFYNRNFYRTHFDHLAWQYALVIQSEKEAQILADAWREHFNANEGLCRWLLKYRDDWQDDNRTGFKYCRRQLAEYLNYEHPGLQEKSDPFALMTLALLNNRRWLPARLLRDLAYHASIPTSPVEDEIVSILEAFFENEIRLAHEKSYEFGEPVQPGSRYKLYPVKKNDNTDTYLLILNLDNTERAQEMAIRFRIPVESCTKATLTQDQADILEQAGLEASEISKDLMLEMWHLLIDQQQTGSR